MGGLGDPLENMDEVERFILGNMELCDGGRDLTEGESFALACHRKLLDECVSLRRADKKSARFALKMGGKALDYEKRLAVAEFVIKQGEACRKACYLNKAEQTIVVKAAVWAAFARDMDEYWATAEVTAADAYIKSFRNRENAETALLGHETMSHVEEEAARKKLREAFTCEEACERAYDDLRN